jgi:hypothetical protein
MTGAHNREHIAIDPMVLEWRAKTTLILNQGDAQ